MKNKMMQTLESIVTLALDAIALERESIAKRSQIRIIQGDFTMKKKLPANVREFRPGCYQGRKTVQGELVTVYGKTPEEAATKLYSAVQAVITRQESTPSAMDIDPSFFTFGEWLLLWRETYKVPKIAQSSLYQIDNVIKNHMPDWIKSLPLSKLTPLLIQRAINGVKSERMREYAYVEYSDSLRWAADLNLIPDLMRTVPAYKAERMPGKAFSVEQQARFLAAADRIADSRLGKLFRFYLLSGARPGEPLTMTAADFDYANDRIHIPGTKNKYSDRYIPFFPQIHDLVDGWLPSDGSRVFPYRADYIAKIMPDLMPGFTPKDLRHTFATRCKECGIPTDVYKQWLGHSKNSTVAEKTYTHYDNVFRIEARKFSLTPPALDPDALK